MFKGERNSLRKKKKKSLPIISEEENISTIKIDSILKEVSSKGRDNNIVCNYLSENKVLFYQENISYIDIKKSTGINVPKIKKIIGDICDLLNSYIEEKNEYIPKMSDVEFLDVLNEFVSQNPSYSDVIEIIKTDPDIMTGNTERFNKTAMCRETNVKTKKIEEILKKLKKFFVESELVRKNQIKDRVLDRKKKIDIKNDSRNFYSKPTISKEQTEIGKYNPDQIMFGRFLKK